MLLLFYLTCDGPGPRASRHCARPSPHISIFHAEQPFARPNRPHLLSLPAASAPQLQQRPPLPPPLFNAHARSPSPSSLHWIARCVAQTRILPTWQAGPVLEDARRSFLRVQEVARARPVKTLRIGVHARTAGSGYLIPACGARIGVRWW